MRIRMNRARMLRRRPDGAPPLYGPDPGDASVEQALAGLLEETRENADQLCRYPTRAGPEGPDAGGATVLRAPDPSSTSPVIPTQAGPQTPVTPPHKPSPSPLTYTDN